MSQTLISPSISLRPRRASARFAFARDENVLDGVVEVERFHRPHLRADNLRIAGGRHVEVEVLPAADRAEGHAAFPVHQGHPGRGLQVTLAKGPAACPEYAAMSYNTNVRFMEFMRLSSRENRCWPRKKN